MAIGRGLGTDANVIQRVDTNGALVGLRKEDTTSHSRLVPGWICPPTSATLQIVWHSISGIPTSAFVCYSPCRTSSLLSYIPHSGYISPEAMVALLSELSSLRTLSLGFESSQSRPDRESRSRPPPERPSILPAPALRTFGFKGVVDYLEELVTRIDAPELSALYINYFNQIDFDAPRLAQFIDRTPKLSKRDEAHLVFCPWGARVVLLYRTYMFDFDDSRIRILCQGPDLQLSLIA